MQPEKRFPGVVDGCWVRIFGGEALIVRFGEEWESGDRELPVVDRYYDAVCAGAEVCADGVFGVDVP